MIILCLLLAIMNTTNNLFNNPLVDRIRDLESQVSALTNARQPFIGDWFKLEISDYAYSSATRITVSNLDPLARFALGGKLEIIQDGDTKYFNITNVQPTYIDIYAGTTYTFTSDPITQISYSTASNPIGFPAVFDYTPTYATGSSNFNIGYFYMDGAVVYAKGANQFTPTGSASTISVSLPITRNYPNSTLEMTDLDRRSVWQIIASTATLYTDVDPFGFGEEILLYRSDGANWNNGTPYYVFWNYSYSLRNKINP